MKMKKRELKKVKKALEKEEMDKDEIKEQLVNMPIIQKCAKNWKNNISDKRAANKVKSLSPNSEHESEQKQPKSRKKKKSKSKKKLHKKRMKDNIKRCGRSDKLIYFQTYKGKKPTNIQDEAIKKGTIT